MKLIVTFFSFLQVRQLQMIKPNSNAAELTKKTHEKLMTLIQYPVFCDRVL